MNVDNYFCFLTMFFLIGSYCECFANERFCDPSCGCQDCKNNSDNKDLVLESRNRTKARNPHAFNPKVTDSQVVT